MLPGQSNSLALQAHNVPFPRLEAHVSDAWDWAPAWVAHRWRRATWRLRGSTNHGLNVLNIVNCRQLVVNGEGCRGGGGAGTG